MCTPGALIYYYWGDSRDRARYTAGTGTMNFQLVNSKLVYNAVQAVSLRQLEPNKVYAPCTD